MVRDLQQSPVLDRRFASGLGIALARKQSSRAMPVHLLDLAESEQICCQAFD